MKLLGLTEGFHSCGDPECDDDHGEIVIYDGFGTPIVIRDEDEQ